MPVSRGIPTKHAFSPHASSTASNRPLVTRASPTFVVVIAVILLREELTLRRLLAIGRAGSGLLVIL